MRSISTRSLALSLGLLLAAGRGDAQVWRSSAAAPAAAAPAAPAASLGRPVAIAQTPTPQPEPTLAVAPAVSLGRPVAIAAAGPAEPAVQVASYANSADPLAPVVRGQAPDPPPPSPTPAATPAPGAASAPASPPLTGWRRGDNVVACNRPASYDPTAAGSGTILPAPIPADGGAGAPLPVGPHSLFATTPPPAAPGDCPSCGCGNGHAACSGLFGCDGVCPPGNRFYVGAEYLLWWMKGDHTPALVTSGNTTDGVAAAGVLGDPNTRVLFGGDQGTGAFSGVRLNAGYWFSDDHCLGLDFGGFLLGPRTTSFNANSLDNPMLSGNGVLSRPFVNAATGAPTAELFGLPGTVTGAVDITRKSYLWGAEANLRGSILCGPNGFLDGVFGYRQLGLNESLGITESDVFTSTALPVAPGSTLVIHDQFNTKNTFYGAQAGVLGEYRFGNFILDGFLKLAMGTTQQTLDVSGSTTMTAPGGATTSTNSGFLASGTALGHFQHSAFTVVPEVGLTLGYQITPHLRAFAGYNFIYWSSVARPGEQVPTSITINTAAGTQSHTGAYGITSTDYWAQGATFGLEFLY
jgi:hypothetical protein